MRENPQRARREAVRLREGGFRFGRAALLHQVEREVRKRLCLAPPSSSARRKCHSPAGFRRLGQERAKLVVQDGIAGMGDNGAAREGERIRAPAWPASRETRLMKAQSARRSLAMMSFSAQGRAHNPRAQSHHARPQPWVQSPGTFLARATRNAEMTVARHYAVFALACLATLAASGDDARASAVTLLQVIPRPAAFEMRRGAFQLADGMRVLAPDPRAAPIARYLVELIARTRGVRLDIGDASAVSSGIRLSLGGTTDPSPEAYELDVTPESVEIRAADSRGLFYGAVTLWQLATADAGRARPTIPALRIKDAPRFAWRGLMLDSARHFQSPSSSSASSTGWRCTSSTCCTGT